MGEYIFQHIHRALEKVIRVQENKTRDFIGIRYQHSNNDILRQIRIHGLNSHLNHKTLKIQC